MPLTFTFNFLVKVQGHDPVPRDPRRPRAAALRLAGQPRPARPAHPDLASPTDFSAKLAEQIGLYRTLGWAERHMAAERGPPRRGRRSSTTASGPSTTARRSSSRSLERDDWDLFVAAIETTDRVSHMMWRLIDPKHPMYDAGAGREVRRLHREGLPPRRRPRGPASRPSCRRTRVFIVMSDHGFHSFRREREPQHLAGAERLHGVRGPGEREEGPGRPVRPRQVLGGRGLEPDPRLRGGPGPDLLQPARPRGAGHRLRGRGVQGAAGRDRGQARRRSRTPTPASR